MNMPNLDAAETAKAEGVYVNGRYLNPSETIRCGRCGYTRAGRAWRDSTCRDCRAVEVRAQRIAPEPPKGRAWTHRGVTTWAMPMSAEDMAWCLAQEEHGFWVQWRKAARHDDNPLQAEAERRVVAEARRRVA